MGVSVLRITEWSYYGNDQTTDSAFAYLPLKNTYTGVAVTLITNGNAEEWPGAFSADNNNWHQFSEKDGTIKASYAAHHHGAWVSELISQGVVTREEIAKVTRRTDAVGAYAGKGWVQAVAFVMLLGFTIMAILAMRTYALSMPLPDKIIGNDGKVIATAEQIQHGQELYQSRGLQQYGSVLGHGAYIGPDFTAEYLRLTTDAAVKQYREEGKQEPRELVKNEWRKENKYDESSKTLNWTAGQTKGFDQMVNHYRDTLTKDNTSQGLFPNAIKSEEELHDLVAFFGWTAWASIRSVSRASPPC